MAVATDTFTSFFAAKNCAHFQIRELNFLSGQMGWMYEIVIDFTNFREWKFRIPQYCEIEYPEGKTIYYKIIDFFQEIRASIRWQSLLFGFLSVLLMFHRILSFLVVIIIGLLVWICAFFYFFLLYSFLEQNIKFRWLFKWICILVFRLCVCGCILNSLL